MKSLYYTALVTRAYRKKLDALDGKISNAEAAPFVAELYNTSHRAFGTGFYFDETEANKTVSGTATSPYKLMGIIGKQVGEGQWKFIARNKLESNTPIEYVGVDICSIEDTNYKLLDALTKEEMPWTAEGHETIINTDAKITEHFIVRARV